jgi:HAD superfamily hydrolase (TIGR01450 family)
VSAALPPTAAVSDPIALERLRGARAFLLDMDGTLYVDEALVGGARELVALLEARGARTLFLTNNSSRRAEEYRARLERLGIPARRDQVLTSGDATIEHLLARTPCRSVCLVGTPALEEEFRAAGLDLETEDPDCVVVGFDTTLTYAKLERACRHLFAGKPFFATHPDRTCITARGLVPDVAAIIAACEAVTGRRPQVIGKPEPEMVDAALRRLSARVDETVMIGDQLDTDMTMARRSGILGVLVLSGETDAARLAAAAPSERPTLTARTVADVAVWLEGAPCC